MSFLRIMRILRLVRIIRLARLLRFVVELQMVIYSLWKCLRSLLWTMVLIILVIYVVSCYLVQTIVDVLRDPGMHGELLDEIPMLDHYFGTLLRSSLSLFQTMTGGVDWENCVEPLTVGISPLMAIVFCVYIAFAVLALLNVVTGIFVEAAVKHGRESTESELIATLTGVFQSSDDDDSGMISWEEFNKHLDNPKMSGYFKNLGIDLFDAPALFMLLDADGNGSIEADEFINGCLRLRGPARGIDLWTLMYTTRKTLAWWEEQMAKVDDLSNLIRGYEPQGSESRKTDNKVATTWKEVKEEAQSKRIPIGGSRNEESLGSQHTARSSGGVGVSTSWNQLKKEANNARDDRCSWSP